MTHASPVVRRGGRLAAIALFAALLALFAGCGAAASTPSAATTRTVIDVTGVPVQVPANPTRVVPLSEPTLDGVLALGVTPIGTVSGRGQSGVPNYLAEQAAGVPLLGGIGQPNYEAAVAAARVALAPVQAKTFSIVRWQGTAPALILKELPPGQALTDLGLRRPAAQDTFGRGHSEPVSLENLPGIDADYMFFGTLGGSSVSNPNAGGTADLAGAEQALKSAELVPGFTRLGAYRAHHIILVDGSAWTSTGGPLLMNRLVDDVRTALG